MTQEETTGASERKLAPMPVLNPQDQFDGFRIIRISFVKTLLDCVV